MGQPKLIEEDDFDSVFSDELEPGHSLMNGQYTIESFLNAGGFGITYRATDSLNRTVVIKECFPGSFCRRTTTSVQARSRAHQRELSSIVRLFVEEARSLARLDHPNIVGVHQVFEENNTAYMALDFVEGRDLLDMIEKPEDVLEPEQIETMLRKMLDAVGFIHNQGVLHRDISPDNILLQPNMEPILIDFGAAREEAGKQSRILSALRVVKDGYSPQEFYISGATQGQFSDLYALGATFYHLITGEVPANSQSRLAAVAAGEPDPYESVIDRMPAYSEAFLFGIDKALEILPKDRIESAEQWLGLLDGTVKISSFASAATTKEKKAAPATPMTANEKASKSKARLLAGVAVLIPVIAGAIVMQSGSSSSDPAVPTAVALDLGAVTPQAAVQSAVNGVTPAVIPQTTAPAPQIALTAPAGDTAVEPSETSVSSTLTFEPLVTATATPEAEAEPVSVAPEAEAAVEPVIETASVTIIAPADVAPAPTLTIPTVVGPIDAPVGTSTQVRPDVTVARAPTASDRPTARPAPVLAEPEIAVIKPVEAAPDVIVEPVIAEPVETVLAAPLPIAEPVVVATNAAASSSWFSTAQDTPIPQLTAVTQTPVTAQVVTERFDIPQVATGWSVDMTGALPAGSNTVFEVNGLPTQGADVLDTFLHQTFVAPDGATMNLEVLAGSSEDTAALQNITVPVVQKTLFLNGTLFETRKFGDAWNTIVVSAPEGQIFQAGDILVGDLGTGAMFDVRTSLPDVLVQANSNSRERLILAVRRDGAVMTLEIPTPG